MQSAKGVDKQAKDAILRGSDYTQVILVDYKQAVRAPNYTHAMTNAELFGHMTNMLAHYKYLDPAKHVYLIVYSLGSHTAHYTAKFLQEKRGRKRGTSSRVSHLDPAAPLVKDCEKCLMGKQDAHFVDIIHSASANGNKFSDIYRVGIAKAFGHVDLYPNGGGRQPACINPLKIAKYLLCSHAMSVEYFINSVKKFRHISAPCLFIDVLKSSSI